jgi:hypothetical protein
MAPARDCAQADGATDGVCEVPWAGSHARTCIGNREMIALAESMGFTVHFDSQDSSLAMVVKKL